MYVQEYVETILFTKLRRLVFDMESVQETSWGRAVDEQWLNDGYGLCMDCIWTVDTLQCITVDIH